MSIRALIAAAAAVIAVLGCTTPSSRSVAPVSRPPGLGEAKVSAIEVCKPSGQRAYLDRLQCTDGSIPAYRRVGSFGGRNELPANLTKEQQIAQLERNFSGAALKPGETDYHVIDGYEVSCGPVKRMIYMDMYHCNQAPPAEIPSGFQLRGPGK
ncbi:hypothetical protein [Variovorax rhizosphaerae]|uniref:DUF4156 domain-containing protein n=1 Tax=Variovorax rhizosphaerae TaxID=1836200 RepID=A0ABU8WP35_9BURK